MTARNLSLCCTHVDRFLGNTTRYTLHPCTLDLFNTGTCSAVSLVAFCRHKILSMLSKNPPFTKAAESPLCTEALVDQLWKLMNSGKTKWAVWGWFGCGKSVQIEMIGLDIDSPSVLRTIGHHFMLQQNNASILQNCDKILSSPKKAESLEGYCRSWPPQSSELSSVFCPGVGRAGLTSSK